MMRKGGKKIHQNTFPVISDQEKMNMEQSSTSDMECCYPLAFSLLPLKFAVC